MPDTMDAVGAILRDYMDGRLELDAAASQLLSLWNDRTSGGWGLYLDENGFGPEDFVRARTIERRFNELIEQHTPRPRSGGTA